MFSRVKHFSLKRKIKEDVTILITIWNFSVCANGKGKTDYKPIGLYIKRKGKKGGGGRGDEDRKNKSIESNKMSKREEGKKKQVCLSHTCYR